MNWKKLRKLEQQRQKCYNKLTEISRSTSGKESTKQRLTEKVRQLNEQINEARLFLYK